jgi:hypothetical protein
MAVQVKDSGIVHTNAKDIAILAVNVLDRLGYQVARDSMLVTGGNLHDQVDFEAVATMGRLNCPLSD